MIKEVIVEVVNYQTSDGKVFPDKQIAQLHEDKLNGDIKYCPECSGAGIIADIGNFRMETCFKCSGSGYLIKMQIWG